LYLEQKGRAPTESELVDTVRYFASEMAESVLAERNEEEATEPSEDGEWEETLDAIRGIGRVDGEALAEDICDAFYDENGEELSLEQLAELWQEAQDDLAAEAQQQSDAEYDPDNEGDAVLAEQDAAEDRSHELDHFEEAAMWSSSMVSAKRGGGASWSVFFDEEDLSEEAECRNFEGAVECFEMMNGREPTSAELGNMKLFLAVTNEAADEDQEEQSEDDEQDSDGEEEGSQQNDEDDDDDDDTDDAEEDANGGDDDAANDEMVDIE